MSKLNKLIQELCPNGVEYRKLGEVCLKITSGGTPSTQNSSYYGGDIPWLRTQEVDFCDIIDTSVKITEKGLNNSSAKWIPANCVIVAMYGATVGKTGINKIPLTTNQACCNLQINSEMALYKYVYYCLANKYEYIKSLGQGSQTNINSQIVKNLSIPLPPLPIQEEIVKILDRFAEYTAELQAELQARKEQYEYYRNLLLTNNFAYGSADDKQKITGNARGEWKWMKMSEIAEIKRGVRVVKSDLSEDCCLYPVFQNCLTPLGYKEASNRKGGIPFIIVGGAAGSIGFSNSDFWAADDCLTIEGNSRVSNRYIHHYLNTRQQYLLSQVRKSSVPRLSRVTIENLMVPVPLLDEQLRIVAILDKFDTLVSDLTQGLPAEIAASQERYEYYRDKLLRFDVKG